MIQITAKNGCLLGPKRLFFQPIHILQQFLFLGFLQIQAANPGNIVLKLKIIICFSQFFPDGPDLFPKIIVLLVLIDDSLCFLLNLGFQLQNLHFLFQKLYRCFQPSDRIQLCQKSALILKIHTGILGNGIRNEAAVIAAHNLQLDNLHRLLRMIQIGTIYRYRFPAKRHISGIVVNRVGRYGFHITGKIGLALGNFHDLCPVDTGHKNPKILILGLQHLLDMGNHTHIAKICQLGIIHKQILLRNQQNMLIVFHGCVQCQNGLYAAYIKMNGLIGKNRQSAQGEDGHFPGKIVFRQGTIPP